MRLVIKFTLPYNAPTHKMFWGIDVPCVAVEPCREYSSIQALCASNSRRVFVGVGDAAREGESVSELHSELAHPAAGVVGAEQLVCLCSETILWDSDREETR